MKEAMQQSEKHQGKKEDFFELAVRRNTIAFKLHLVCNEPT